MKLNKYSDNPILSPNDNYWENLSVCNPGVWYEDGIFYMLYRAAGNDKDYIMVCFRRNFCLSVLIITEGKTNFKLNLVK